MQFAGELPAQEATPLFQLVLDRYAADELSAPATHPTWRILYGELLLGTDRAGEAEQHFREALQQLDPSDRPNPIDWRRRAMDGLALAKAKLRR